MRSLRDELDLRRKTEIHEVEERKNAQINELTRNHEKAFSDIKNYYNDVMLNSLALINTLKVVGLCRVLMIVREGGYRCVGRGGALVESMPFAGSNPALAAT